MGCKTGCICFEFVPYTTPQRLHLCTAYLSFRYQHLEFSNTFLCFISLPYLQPRSQGLFPARLLYLAINEVFICYFSNFQFQFLDRILSLKRRGTQYTACTMILCTNHKSQCLPGEKYKQNLRQSVLNRFHKLNPCDAYAKWFESRFTAGLDLYVETTFFVFAIIMARSFS